MSTQDRLMIALGSIGLLAFIANCFIIYNVLLIRGGY
jgi:hypothetical protein